MIILTVSFVLCLFVLYTGIKHTIFSLLLSIFGRKSVKVSAFCWKKAMISHKDASCTEWFLKYNSELAEELLVWCLVPGDCLSILVWLIHWVGTEGRAGSKFSSYSGYLVWDGTNQLQKEKNSEVLQLTSRWFSISVLFIQTKRCWENSNW